MNNIEPRDDQLIKAFINNPTECIQNILGGWKNTGNSERWSLATRLTKAAIQRKFFERLYLDIEELQQKGQINKDYLSDTQKLEALQEILYSIDGDNLGEKQFLAIKKLFIWSILDETEVKERYVTHYLMKICRCMTSEDLLIVRAAYEIYNGTKSEACIKNRYHDSMGCPNVLQWISLTSDQIGFDMPAMVACRVEYLQKLGIIHQSMDKGTENEYFVEAGYFRLTELGFKLCNYIYSETMCLGE